MKIEKIFFESKSYFEILTKDGKVILQRKYPYLASDSPLSTGEEIIVALIEYIKENIPR